MPDLFQSDEGRRELARVNPLAQVPTLVMPDGTVMTESASIALHLAEASGRDDFVPPPGHAARAPFLRWLVFLLANAYPTFTYADDPKRFTPGNEEAAKAFVQQVGEYRRRLWQMAAPVAGAPWFLGERFSALDLYVSTMTHWQPGRRWFEEHAPGLLAIAQRVIDEPRYRGVLRRHSPRDYEAAR